MILDKFIKEKGIDSLLIVTDSGLMGLGMVNPLIDALKEKEIKVAVENPDKEDVNSLMKDVNIKRSNKQTRANKCNQ